MSKGGEWAMNEMWKNLTTFTEDILEKIMPNHYKCFGCGKSDAYYESYLCESCISKLDFSHISCRICGAKLTSNFSICGKCKSDGLSMMFERIYPCAYYNEFAKDLLHRYKYLHERYLSKLFAKMLFDKLSYEQMEFDIIVPLISGAQRIRKRGFDHIDDLCNELSKLTNKQVLRLLKRVNHDVSQVEKTYDQRVQDMENSFVLDEQLCDCCLNRNPKVHSNAHSNADSNAQPNSYLNADSNAQQNSYSNADLNAQPSNQADSHPNAYLNQVKLLLVDDLYTTGSTIRSAGFVLKEHFKHIGAITVFHG